MMPKHTSTSLIIGILLIGCAGSGQAEQNINPMRAQLDRISDDCETPREWLILHDDERVEIRLPPDAAFEDVECVLAGLREAQINNLGFIGNGPLPAEGTDL